MSRWSWKDSRWSAISRLHEARFYERQGDEVLCRLCPKLCTIREGRTGFCRVRQNQGGVLYALNYGECSSYALDPIEKKPLYHFYPGSVIFSLGTVGCNLHCGFCQNWEIAHGKPRTVYLTPEQVVALARRETPGYRNIGLAYTYSEPQVWYEFVYDTAVLAREAGLKNVLVTNGYVNEEPLRQLLPYIDAMNIDVKAFTEDYYRKVCHGHLAPVLRTVEVAREHCHVEITTLLVPGLNDDPAEIAALRDWVASLDPDIPVHFSRYFPNYKFKLEPTPIETLRRAREIALEKLRYVYLGNVWERGAGNTYCPQCGALVIARSGYTVRITGLSDGNCSTCGYSVKLVLD